MRPFTSHNDKLGFDYSIPDSAYKWDRSKHPKTSTYKEFLNSAAQFIGNSNQPLSDHYKNMVASFNMNLSDMKQRNTNLTDLYVAGGDRSIEGLNQQIAK